MLFRLNCNPGKTPLSWEGKQRFKAIFHSGKQRYHRNAYIPSSVHDIPFIYHSLIISRAVEVELLTVKTKIDLLICFLRQNSSLSPFVLFYLHLKMLCIRWLHDHVINSFLDCFAFQGKNESFNITLDDDDNDIYEQTVLFYEDRDWLRHQGTNPWK